MKVKLLTSRATTTRAQNIGEIIEVGDAEGQRMIDAGQCELIEATPAKKTPENVSTKR